jgi:Raf kinase inhibitor-like YbhB/YbcL family protein
MVWEFSSTAFEDGGDIPRTYTCDGKDINPPLAWADPPANSQSLALILDDPDAPRGLWIHWVLYNIPPNSHGLPEGIPMQRALADGSTHGRNSWGRMDYGGPCPPGGTHRYVFHLYALDSMLALPAGATADQVRQALEGHTLGEAGLMGRYGR